MNLRKISVTAGGVVAIALLLLATPRASHAIVAALVQVANTAANPAIAQDVTRLASQNMMLVLPGGSLAPHGSASFYQMFSDGTTGGSPFVVPAGQSFVMTGFDAGPDGTSGLLAIGFYNQGSSNLREEFYVPANSAVTTQFQIPNGIVFAAGETLSISNYGISGSNAIVYVHGYLTSN